MPADSQARKSSTTYQSRIVDADPMGFKALERLMDKRTTCGAECHFVNKELIEKFFAEMD